MPFGMRTSVNLVHKAANLIDYFAVQLKLAAQYGVSIQYIYLRVLCEIEFYVHLLVYRRIRVVLLNITCRTTVRCRPASLATETYNRKIRVK